MKPELNNIGGKNKSTEIVLVIRGMSFRSNIEDQISCLESIRNKIIIPLLKESFDVSVLQCTYDHKFDYIIKEELTRGGGIKSYEYYPQNKSIIKNQTESFLDVVEKLKFREKSALIIRPDLFFLKDIVTERFFDDLFLFQWNTFHNVKLKEVPDQIHYIGKDVLEDVFFNLKESPHKMSTLPDGTGKKSLHNLYNHLSQINSIKDKVSFIYYFCLKDNDYINNRCNLRGNSRVSSYPEHIYRYTRK